MAEAVNVTRAALASSTRVYTATRAASVSRTYAVHSGDTLSSISSHFYGKSGDWQWLYHVNHGTVSDPNLIYPGQKLSVPANPPANYTLPASEAPAATTTTGYQPKHAYTPASSSDCESGSTTASAPAPVSHDSGAAVTTSAGTYSCGGLESLWEQAGGSAGEAVMATMPCWRLVSFAYC